MPAKELRSLAYKIAANKLSPNPAKPGSSFHANALNGLPSTRRSWATQLIDSIGCLWREAGRSCERWIEHGLLDVINGGEAALLTSPAERPIHRLRWQVLHPRARARVGRKRPRRFEIFDDRAQVNRFGIKRFVLRDLGPIQNIESVALEHLFATPAFKGDDLPINALLAAAIKITEIRAHQ